MNWIFWGAIILFCYLLGSLHGSQIVQWKTGVNLKENGLKNAGASNATIVLGFKYGAFVGLFDIGKGVMGILLVKWFVTMTPTLTSSYWPILFAAAAALIIGHNHSIFMRGQGGKGTATIIGVLLALNWPAGLIALSLLLLLTWVTDYLLIGVFVFYVSFLIYTIFWIHEWSPIVVISGLLVMACIRHIENFQRLFAGNEPKISQSFKKKKLGSDPEKC